ncbi:MAG: hypothetical protein IJ220_09240 [Clostridia bacterium]|nr:hypothetical protein [Clostridia bacterium]
MKYVNRLTRLDIIQLLQFGFVYDFEECESSNQKTRAFRMKRSINGSILNAIIGDFYEEGNLRLLKVDESHFLGFMIQKFGREYFEEWYRRQSLCDKNKH